MTGKDRPTLDGLDTDVWTAIRAPLTGKRIAAFLDYDGTVTPIVPRPEDALLAEPMREALRRLAQRHAVLIVSGRDRADVERRVGLAEAYYAGSHGFDISGPDNLHMQHEWGLAALPALDEAERHLRERLDNIAGSQVERKRFAIAVHYRNAGEADVPRIERAVGEVDAQHPSLRRRGGKKVFELQPDVEWDKGRAVLWLLEALRLNRPDVVPLYVGDDLTDEDAFRALAGRGLSIFVGPEQQPTAARFRLRDVREVQCLIEALADWPGAAQRE